MSGQRGRLSQYVRGVAAGEGCPTEDDATVIAALLFTGEIIRVAGYDREGEARKGTPRSTDIDVTDPDPIFAGFDVLESRLRERYRTDGLARFDLDVGL